jgi:hypothetical protein
MSLTGPLPCTEEWGPWSALPRIDPTFHIGHSRLGADQTAGDKRYVR